MKEQIKAFWKENKESIKTGTILVMTPIVILGLVTTKALSDIGGLCGTISKEIEKGK